MDTITLNAPSKKAKDVFSEAVVSLLPAMKTLLLHYFNKFLKLQIDLMFLTAKIVKMEQGKLIPKSARSNFTLSSKEKDKESDARQSLHVKVDELKTSYQTSLKDAIIANMKLDKESMTTTLKDTVCDAFFRVVQMFFYIQYQTDGMADDIVHTHVLDIAKRTQHSLQYSFVDGYDEFERFYKNKFNYQPMNDDNDNSVATDISVLTEGEEASLQFARHIGETRTIITRTSIGTRTTNTRTRMPTHVLTTDNITIIRTVLYKVFTTTWAMYKHEHDQRALNAMLVKHTTTLISTETTDTVASVINGEPTADQKLLKDIITSEVAKATKELKNQIGALKQSTRSVKNGKRGAKTPAKRADTKKSTAKRSQQQSPPKKKGKSQTKKDKEKTTSTARKTKKSEKAGKAAEKDSDGKLDKKQKNTLKNKTSTKKKKSGTRSK
jgi:hypothetical protein